MAVNRLLYSSVLAVAVAFYFSSSVWFSWILLLVVAAIPWVSLLFSLAAMLSSRLICTVPETAEQGVPTWLRLRVRAIRAVPLADVQLRLRLSYPGTQQEYRYLSRLSRTDGSLALPTEHCGCVKMELQKIRIYDYLGLIPLPRRKKALRDLIVLPRPVEPQPRPDLESFLMLQLKPKPGGGLTEVYDHRPYREGDPVRSIHWKLSLKTDEMIVREALEPVKRRTALAVETPGSPEDRDLICGRLRWLSDWMLEHKYEHTVLWMDGDRLRRDEVTDEHSARRTLMRVCAAAPDSAPLPENADAKADWIYRIRRTGGGS